MIYLALAAILLSALYAHRCRAAVRSLRATAESDVAALTARVRGLEEDLAGLEAHTSSATDRDVVEAIERLARGGYGPSFTQCAIVTNEGAELYRGPSTEHFRAAVLRVAARRLPTQ